MNLKPLKDMVNSEKARLLHELFPDEMPKLLEDIKAVCTDFQERKEEYTKNWNDGFVPFNYWLSLSQETANIIKRHGLTMVKSSRVFSDQLFYTYTFLFVNDRIIKYAERVSEDEKFKQAVKMLYT
jgi:hypothetical protein